MSSNYDITRYDFIRNDPRLEVALVIAQEAHRGQFRRAGNRPYIEHPLLVTRILNQFGCSDVQKAVGLLHDVREENEILFPNIKTLEKTLQRRLADRCNPQTEAEKENLELWASDVCKGVEELTNGTRRKYAGKVTWLVGHKLTHHHEPEIITDGVMQEDKRTWQVAHANDISDEFKAVKIIDQAASVIDGILYCDPHDWAAMKQEKAFALKGLDVSRACRGDDHNNPYHEFYKRIFAYFVKNYKLAYEGDFIAVAARRNEFNIERAVKDSLAPAHRKKIKPEEVLHYYSPGFPGIEKGIARITVSKATHKVVGYGIIVQPEKDKHDPINALALDFRKKLEDSTALWVETYGVGKVHRKFKEMGTEEYEHTSVRDLKIKPPMSLAKFFDNANAVGAIEESFMLNLGKEYPAKRSRIVLG